MTPCPAARKERASRCLPRTQGGVKWNHPEAQPNLFVDPSGLCWQDDVPLGLGCALKSGPELSRPHHKIPNGCDAAEMGNPISRGSQVS